MNVEYKSISFSPTELKSEGGKLNIKGYAAAFGNIDSYRDIIDYGAFDQTLQNDAHRVKLCYMHDIRQVVGKINALRTDDKGLYIDYDILPTSLGKDLMVLCENKAINEMSIGYYTRKSEDDVVDGVSVRRLKAIELIEVSLVSRAANPQAVISNVSRKFEDVIPSLKDCDDKQLESLVSAIKNEQFSRIFNLLINS